MSAGTRRLVAVPDPIDRDLAASIEQRFVREAALDRWVQAHGQNLREAYEEHASSWTMLALAQSPWMSDEADRRLCDRAVASVASAVAASVSINLEPACARLLWASERERFADGDALEAAEHYALLGLAAAKRASEREAAECVREAARFLGERGPTGASTLHRFSELAERRLVNTAALVGAHLPFWRFPFAYRWSREAPRYGRGPRGMAEPVADDAFGLLSLAYRSGMHREEIASAIDRCATSFRREPAIDSLAHARGTAAIAEFALSLEACWSITGATSPADVIDRIVPRVLSIPWLSLGEAPARIHASRLATPVLARLWPELASLADEHARFAASQRELSAVA